MFKPDHADADRPTSPVSAARRQPSARQEAGAVVLALLPWGVSVLFHAALVMVAFFLIWAVIADEAEEQVVIPEIRLSDDASRAMRLEPTRTLRTESSSRRTVTRADTPTATATLTRAVNPTARLIGVQGAMGSKASPFGVGLTDGPGPGTKTFGPTGNARRIVFVVDASGSLLDTFPFVIADLKLAIDELKEEQSFSIIFFQGDQAVEVPATRGVRPATGKLKRLAKARIDPASGNIQPLGATNPLPGIQQALRYQPEVMYLLSDNITGGGTGATMYEIERQRLLDAIERANTGGTKINTIQFLYPDPLAHVLPGGKGTLERVAEMTGGEYRFVDAQRVLAGSDR